MDDKGVIIQGLPIYNLKFADDVDLIDKDPDNLQVMLNKLCKDSKRYGMCINKDKTSYDISEISAEWRIDTFNTLNPGGICTELYIPRKHDIVE